MNAEIEFYVKNVYGREVMYIKNETIATIVQKLTGQKTISKSHVTALEELGFELIEVIAPR